MKKINYITAIMTLCLVFQAVGQKKEIDLFTIPLSDSSKPGTLYVEQISGSINVVAYDGYEVIVKATILEDDNCRNCDERKGMKRVSGSSVNISGEEKDNVVEIHNEMFNTETQLDIKVPKNFSLKLSTINNGDIYVENVIGAIEVSNVNGDITLNDISGSASADTTNGEVKVSFEKLDTSADMAFSSFNGDVVVTFPTSFKANVKAKSDRGDVFTDFDMVVSKTEPEVEHNSGSGSYKVKVEQWVRGKINGGGPEIFFKTYNGDILIKSK